MNEPGESSSCALTTPFRLRVCSSFRTASRTTETPPSLRLPRPSHDLDLAGAIDLLLPEPGLGSSRRGSGSRQRIAEVERSAPEAHFVGLAKA
jgi:hypothetical protein